MTKQDMELMANAMNEIPTKADAPMSRSSDQVARTMQIYVEDDRCTQEEHGLLLWLFLHGKKRALSYDGIGKLINYSGATVSRIFAGKYEGNMSAVIDAVRGYQHLNSEREKMQNDSFIETSIWESIRSVCDLALLRNAPVRIVGLSQIGKTRALKEYKRRAKFNCFYCRIPAAPTFRLVLETIAQACGINTALRNEELRRRIPGALNRQTILIIDELHELALSASKGTAMKAMEYIREIFDVSGCGLVVCGTRSMEDDLIHEAGLRGWLDQFDQRCIRKLKLPLRLPPRDIALAAEAYGFPEPDGSCASLLDGIRMNRLCTCLNMAAAVAAKKGLERNWDLFKTTYKKVFGE